MNEYQSEESKQIDELLRVLVDQYSRATISYLRESSDDVVSVQHLTNEISKQNNVGTTVVNIQLYHSILPRLADAGVLEYDRGNQTVQYHGDPKLEHLLNSISEISQDE